MKRIILAENAPKPVGPYNQAIEVNNMLFLSGQIPISPLTGAVVEGGIQEQTKQVLENVKSVLKDAGYSLKDVVKSTCMLKSLDDFKVMNEIYATYFTENYPVRSTYQVAKLPLDVMVEIEVLAIKS